MYVVVNARFRIGGQAATPFIRVNSPSLSLLLAGRTREWCTEINEDVQRRHRTTA